MTENKVFIDINGERIELIGEALNEHLKNQEIYADYLARKQKEVEDIMAQKQIVLDRLGLSADEAKLLLS